MAKPTFGGDPLVRIKQFIEAAQRDTKTSGKDKRKPRLNVEKESFSGGSGSCGASAVGRRGAGEEEHWRQVGKTGKSNDDAVKKHEKQLPMKPEGLDASHWRGTVVALAEFISLVSTARAGDHIIAGVAAEEPPELGGLLVHDWISATLIALPTMKTSHPTQELSAPTLRSRGVVRLQRVGMLQWGTPAFPLAWKTTSVASQATAAE